MKNKDKFIVFRIEESELKQVVGNSRNNNNLNLLFCQQTQTWKLADNNHPLNELLVSIQQFLLTEKRFQGTASELVEQLKALDVNIDYAPNTLTRLFNRHSISMEYEYGILYQRKKRISGARKFILSLRK